MPSVPQVKAEAYHRAQWQREQEKPAHLRKGRKENRHRSYSEYDAYHSFDRDFGHLYLGPLLAVGFKFSRD